MYLKLFHAAKRVSGKFSRRCNGLLKYILDYKIILFSLTYLLANELVRIGLRNIPEGIPMGLPKMVGLVPIGVVLKKILKKKKTEIPNKNLNLETGRRKENKFFVLFIILLIATSIAVERNLPVLINEQEVKKKTTSFTKGSTLFMAYISKEVQEKHSSIEATVQPLEDIISDGIKIDDNSSLVLLKLPTFYKLEIGQVCEISGILSKPENFENFDYISYLGNQKIFFIMDNPIIKCKPVSNLREGSIFRNQLVDFKNHLIRKVDSVLNEPQSSLLAGILFGQKRLFSYTFDDATRVSGVSHIVAASGYNVTVLTLIVNRIFSFLPKRMRLLVIFFTIWSFAVLSGLSSSIVRACIMSSISLIALLFGRNNSIHMLLPFTSFLFILISPTALSNVGFLLSMSAVLGLVYLLPVLIKFRKNFFCKLKFLDNLVLPTLSCTLTTLPVSIIVFKTFSIWSVPVNSIILPVLESTMLFGFLAILFQSLFPAISYLFYSIVNVQLLYFEKVVIFVKELNFGQFILSDNSSLFVGLAVLLVLIISVTYFYPIKNEQYNHYLKNT